MKLNAVGRNRSMFLVWAAVNDEREQLLKQLLVGNGLL